MFSEDGVAHKSFRHAGGATEHFLSLSVCGALAFEEQMDQLERRYQDVKRRLDLSERSTIWRRVFVSDVINQAPLIRNSVLARESADNPVAISLVQQPPLPSAKLALLAYHIEDDGPVNKRRVSANHVLVERNGRRSLWTTGLCAGESHEGPSACDQTRGALTDLIAALDLEGGNLKDHCVRTWFYVKDIDVFYHGLVEGRAAVFAEQGLTGSTHYLASTGIEGACSHRYDLVAMDAYSELDLEPAQVSYLNDFDQLCPTRDYGVHFERGTTITYGDRAHHFISGTASIGRNGQVLYPNDIRRQFERALENIGSLLRAGHSQLSDLAYVIVYLRDPADFPAVEAFLRENLSGIPAVVVQAAVCRPQWLIEIEGIAVSPRDEPLLPRF